MLVFARELRRNLRPWLVWAGALALVAIAVIAVYPGASASQVQLEELVARLPRGMISAFGLDRLNLSGILDYYAVKGLILTLLLSSIYAVQLTAGIIAKEESDKTIEFLLAKPVTRRGLLTAKVAVAGLLVVLLNAVLAAAGLAGLALAGAETYSVKAFWWLAAGGLLINLTFAALGLLVAVFVTRPKALYPLSTGLVLAAYMAGVLAKLSSKLGALRWLSPFNYADPPDILAAGAIGGGHLAVFAVLIIGVTATAFVLYERKDIAA